MHLSPTDPSIPHRPRALSDSSSSLADPKPWHHFMVGSQSVDCRPVRTSPGRGSRALQPLHPDIAIVTCKFSVSSSARRRKITDIGVVHSRSQPAAACLCCQTGISLDRLFVSIRDVGNQVPMALPLLILLAFLSRARLTRAAEWLR